MSRNTVLLLGVYHFHTDFNNALQIVFPDPSTAVFQRQVEELVDSLASFRADRVCIPVVPPAHSVIERYRNYLENNKISLSLDEHEQIGFRLARQLGHSSIYPIYHMNDTPFGSALSSDSSISEWFFDYIEERGRKQSASFRTAPLADILRVLNSRSHLEEDHSMFLRVGLARTETENTGATALSAWYERNIKIFANIAKEADKGGRTLVLVTASHIPIIRQLLEDVGCYRLEEVDPYLNVAESV